MKRVLIIMLIALGLLTGATALASTYESDEPEQHVYTGPVALDLSKANLLKLVNEERARNDVGPLEIDSRLNESAQRKADDMVKYDYFEHDRSGVFLMEQFIRDTGLQCIVAGENLHEGDYSVTSATRSVNGWISSKAHHEAMIDPEYTLTGFGYATADNRTKVVQHFCKPL